MQGQDVADGEHSPNIAILIRSKLTSTRIYILLVGTFSLILVPGVVLGVLSGQVVLGIALSSAIATVMGTFAGYYYHYSRKP